MTYPESAGFKTEGTSRLAAESIKISAKTLREYVLRTLINHPDGMTTDECASFLRESLLSIRPRFSELLNRGMIQDSGRRRSNHSGRFATVWIIRWADQHKKEIA